MFCGLPMGVIIEPRFAATVCATSVMIVERGSEPWKRCERDEGDIVRDDHGGEEGERDEQEREASLRALGAGEKGSRTRQQAGACEARHDGHEAEEKADGAPVDCLGVCGPVLRHRREQASREERCEGGDDEYGFSLDEGANSIDEGELHAGPQVRATVENDRDECGQRGIITCEIKRLQPCLQVKGEMRLWHVFS